MVWLMLNRRMTRPSVELHATSSRSDGPSGNHQQMGLSTMLGVRVGVGDGVAVTVGVRVGVGVAVGVGVGGTGPMIAGRKAYLVACGVAVSARGARRSVADVTAAVAPGAVGNEEGAAQQACECAAGGQP